MSGSSLPKNKSHKLALGFRRIRDLMANIFWMKQEVDNHVRALESRRGRLHRPKILWTSVHKLLNIGPEISPTLRNGTEKLHPNGTQPNFAKREEINGADASRIRWRRIVNVNETIDIRSLMSRSLKQHFILAMASRRAVLSGNTSLNATFSSFHKSFPL